MITEQVSERLRSSLPNAWAVIVLVIRGLAAAGILLNVTYGLFLRTSDATLNHLLADIRAGLVTDIAYVSDSDFGLKLLGPSEAYSDGDWVVWRTVDGSRHAFQDTPVLDSRERDPALEDVERSDGTNAVHELINRELARQRSPLTLHHGTVVPGWLTIWLTGAWAVVLATLVAGPQPRLVTKWAWFWLLMLPFGLGLLGLLALEAPWSRRASARPEPQPHAEQAKQPGGDRRLTGGRAFLVALVLGPLVLSMSVVPLLTWLGVNLSL